MHDPLRPPKVLVCRIAPHLDGHKSPHCTKRRMFYRVLTLWMLAQLLPFVVLKPVRAQISVISLPRILRT